MTEPRTDTENVIQPQVPQAALLSTVLLFFDPTQLYSASDIIEGRQCRTTQLKLWTITLSSIAMVFLKTRCLGQMYWIHRNASYFVIFNTIIVIILITGISFAIFIKVFLARVRQKGAVILAKRNNQYIMFTLCQNDLPGEKSRYGTPETIKQEQSITDTF